ncbi:MAG: hypothetical protein PUC05_05805 [Firmicutes bacterium]|nr:hypothetical protein [Bacillota bacterium]
MLNMSEEQGCRVRTCRRGDDFTDQRDKVMKAFIKRACGYKAKEEVRELRQVIRQDGTTENEMVLTKVISKDVPADLSAARWYLEGGGQSETLTLEEAARLIDEQE